MKAVGYNKADYLNNEVLVRDIELPEPVVEGNDILVEVKAISINPVDYKIRQRVEPDEGDFKVLGWDAAGIVKDVGSRVTLFQPGDKVYYAGDLTRQGSMAQFQLIDERIVAKMPTNLSYAQAAALPLTSLTAWEMIFDRLKIENEETATPQKVLVIGAAGGVGSILVQLMLQQTSLELIATASKEESVEWLQQLGVPHIINHHESLASQLSEIAINEIDYIISLNSTDKHFPEIVNLIAPQGHFGFIDDPVSMDIMQLKTKSATIHFEFMFTRSMYQTPDMVRQHQILTEIANLIEEGTIQTTLNKVSGKIQATDVNQVLNEVGNHQSFGKIVLEGF